MHMDLKVTLHSTSLLSSCFAPTTHEISQEEVHACAGMQMKTVLQELLDMFLQCRMSMNTTAAMA